MLHSSLSYASLHFSVSCNGYMAIVEPCAMCSHFGDLWPFWFVAFWTWTMTSQHITSHHITCRRLKKAINGSVSEK